MIGIYKIQNLITGEIYIGQSRNIEDRFYQHLHHYDSKIDKAIHEYGAHNFHFDIVELCEPELLDTKEDYYIREYKSNIDGIGYNIVRGGQHNIGESNSNVKLTEKDMKMKL